MGLGHAGRLHPAADAADTGHVRHHQVAGLRLQRLQQGLGTVEVFAQLQRQSNRGGDGGIARQVVVPDRLFQPRHALELQCLSARQRVDA